MKPGREPTPAAERGPEGSPQGSSDTIEDTAAPLDVQSLYDLVVAIETGRYSAEAGTVGAWMLGQHPGCRWSAERSLAEFAEVVYRREGLWWASTLAADDSSLDESDAAYVATCWRHWLVGDPTLRKPR